MEFRAPGQRSAAGRSPGHRSAPRRSLPVPARRGRTCRHQTARKVGLPWGPSQRGGVASSPCPVRTLSAAEVDRSGAHGDDEIRDSAPIVAPGCLRLVCEAPSLSQKGTWASCARGRGSGQPRTGSPAERSAPRGWQRSPRAPRGPLAAAWAGPRPPASGTSVRPCTRPMASPVARSRLPRDGRQTGVATRRRGEVGSRLAPAMRTGAPGGGGGLGAARSWGPQSPPCLLLTCTAVRAPGPGVRRLRLFLPLASLAHPWPFPPPLGGSLLTLELRSSLTGDPIPVPGSC